MRMHKWVQRWGASAVSVCLAVGTNGCVVAQSSRNEDVLVGSKSVSSPAPGTAYSAELSAPTGQPISVRTFQQGLCTVAEHQIVDRTVVTWHEPNSWIDPRLVGAGAVLVLGGGSSVLGSVLDSEYRKKTGFVFGTSMVGVGAALIGVYAYQSLASGEKRRHVGQVERDIPQGSRACGPATPIGDVAVKLVNQRDGRELLMRTNGQGQAAIPEAEVAKLDAPLRGYVEGHSANVNVNEAATERVRAAGTAEREKRLLEEARLAEAQRKEEARLAEARRQEEEKRALEEARLARKQLQDRARRADVFRKAVKVGDNSH